MVNWSDGWPTAESSVLGMSAQVAGLVARKINGFDESIVTVEQRNDDGSWWFECFRYSQTAEGEIKRERFSVRCPADWTCWVIARHAGLEAA